MAETPSTDILWRELSDELRAFLRRRVADEHVAEDLLQDAFLRIHQHLDELRETPRVRAWVFQIGRNVIADHRRRHPVSSRALTGDVESEVPDEPPDACGWIESFLERLPERDRAAVRMAEIDALGHREIAARLGLSLSGARSRVSRGRDRLRRELEACCRFELDRRGKVLDATPRDPGPCGEDPGGCGP